MEKKERNVTTTETVYVAFDGLEFKTEFECENYEFSEVGKLLAELNCYGYLTHDNDKLFESWYKYYILMPRTRHDVFVINRILEIGGSEQRFLSDYLYRPVMLKVTTCLPSHVCTNVEFILLDDWMKSISDGKFSVVSLVKEDVEKKSVK